MSVYYYEPFFSINDVSRLFDNAFFTRGGSPSQQQLQRTISSTGGDPTEQQRAIARGFQPRLDIHESRDSGLLTATLELPGLKREDVAIDVQENRLVVSGTQTFATDVEESGYVHRERRTGRFSRTLPLPAGTKPADIKAKLEDGLLTISFPKTSAEQTPQRITIA